LHCPVFIIKVGVALWHVGGIVDAEVQTIWSKAAPLTDSAKYQQRANISK
jgi:hypothetical protein